MLKRLLNIKSWQDSSRWDESDLSDTNVKPEPVESKPETSLDDVLKQIKEQFEQVLASSEVAQYKTEVEQLTTDFWQYAQTYDCSKPAVIIENGIVKIDCFDNKTYKALPKLDMRLICDASISTTYENLAGLWINNIPDAYERILCVPLKNNEDLNEVVDATAIMKYMLSISGMQTQFKQALEHIEFSEFIVRSRYDDGSIFFNNFCSKNNSNNYEWLTRDMEFFWEFEKHYEMRPSLQRGLNIICRELLLEHMSEYVVCPEIDETGDFVAIAITLVNGKEYYLWENAFNVKQTVYNLRKRAVFGID